MHKGNSRTLFQRQVYGGRDIRFHEPREISAEDTVEKLGNDLVVKPVDQGAALPCISAGSQRVGTVLGDLAMVSG